MYVIYGLFLMVAVQVDRTAVWVFAIPVSVGLLLLVSSWVSDVTMPVPYTRTNYGQHVDGKLIL